MADTYGAVEPNPKVTHTLNNTKDKFTKFESRNIHRMAINIVLTLTYWLSRSLTIHVPSVCIYFELSLTVWTLCLWFPSMDPYAGLSKVNTPLQTPLALSLEEWCTSAAPPDRCHYQLFAVVMHSGVTISSGHYTAYVRMSELHDVRLQPQSKEKEQQKEREEVREEEEEQEERRGGDSTKQQQQEEEEEGHYDDGEVSFGGARGLHRGKAGGKKTEGVGGQRSAGNGYELTGSKQADKIPASGVAEAPRRRTTTSGPVKQEAEEGKRVKEEREALSSLLHYEGKWLLFDDSEVRLFEEEDFLRACSPDTCSTSTPYLLFYKRTPLQGTGSMQG